MNHPGTSGGCRDSGPRRRGNRAGVRKAERIQQRTVRNGNQVVTEIVTERMEMPDPTPSEADPAQQQQAADHRDGPTPPAIEPAGVQTETAADVINSAKPEINYRAQVESYLCQQVIFCPRTEDTARGLNRKGIAWCRDHGMDDESVIKSICAAAVISAMAMQPEEQQLGALYNNHRFQKNIDAVNRIAQGRAGRPHYSLARRLGSWFNHRLLGNPKRGREDWTVGPSK